MWFMSTQCSERARVTTGDLILRVLGRRPSPPQRVPCALLPDLLATAPLPSGFPFAPFPGARPRLGLGRRLLLSASNTDFTHNAWLLGTCLCENNIDHLLSDVS